MTKDRRAKRAARERQGMSDGPYSAARRATEWPPQMVLEIDTPHHITQLLYLRAAWGLHTAVEPPELDPQPESGDSAAPPSASREEWARRWDAQWAMAWEWYRIEQHRAGLAGLTSARMREIVGDGSELNPVMPPMWSFRYGDDGFDHVAYSAWQRSFTRIPHGRLEDQPERRSVQAVTAAWRTGLEAVIVLPYANHHAERITPRHLVVSDVVWQATALREHALALPVARAGDDHVVKGGA